MKMRKSMAALLILFFYLALCIPAINSTSSPSIVHTDTNLALPYTQATPSFTENCSGYNRTWVFYYDDWGNNIEYKYSENGITWIQPDNSPMASYELYSNHYNVYWCANISYVYVVWVTPHLAEGGQYVLLRRGQFNNETTDFDWDAINEVQNYSSYPYGELLCPSVIVDTWNSKVFVFFGRYQTGQYLVFKRSVDLECSSWSGQGSMTSPSSRVAYASVFMLRNDTDPLRSDIFVVSYDASMLSSYRYYTINETWRSEEDIYYGYGLNQVSFKASYYNGTCHVVYRKTPSTGYIATKTYNKTTNTWGNEYFVTNSELVGYFQGIGMFGNSSIEYAFFSHLDKIYYCSRASQTVNFSSPEIWLNVTGLSESIFSSWVKGNENEPSYVQFTWLRVGSDIVEFAVFGDDPWEEEEPAYLTTDISSSPEINVNFDVNTTIYTTPESLNLTTGSYIFTAELEHTYSGTIYEFDYWQVNSTNYYTYIITLDLSANTTSTLIIHYNEQAENPDIPPIFDPEAINATWYMRSDTLTSHEILGYKLHEYQSYTETSDSRYSSTETVAVSYGVRIWTLDASGNKEELSSGSPVAIMMRDDNSSGMLSETWDCPEYSYIVDAVQVNVYQRFGSGAWSLRRIFITEEALLIRFPESTWTFYYYVEHDLASTNSTFYHGSLSYASRMIFQYYRISVFEKMTYHLQQFQLLSFLVTPWTYYLGTMFYGILLFFFATTAYLRYHSLKAVLAVFWLFGGTGGFLSAMMPAMGLQISWLILALTLTITIFHLIYGRKT